MLHRRRSHRGLAEIVGTLMLVVIVVAAATAFSFFVAAYQKQLQAQETQSHNRSLEDVKVIDVSEVTCASGACEPGAAPNSFSNVSFLVASLDINTIWITGLFLNGIGVVNFYATYPNGSVTLHPCYNASRYSGTPLSGLTSCAALPLFPYSTVRILLNLDDSNDKWEAALGGPDDQILGNSDLSFQLLTQLTNLFTETFSPPDAVASIFFVSSGGSSVPVLDGLSSYQPASANNASILSYAWALTALPNVSAPAVDSVTTWSGTASYTGSGSCADVTIESVSLLPSGSGASGSFGPATLGAGLCAGSEYSVPFTVTFTALLGGTLTATATMTYADTAGSWIGPTSGTVTADPAPTLASEGGGISGSATIPVPPGIGYSGGFEVTTLQYPGTSFVGVTGSATYSGGTGGEFSVTWDATSYSSGGVVVVPTVYGTWEYNSACGGGASSGPELECSGLVSGVEYSIALTVMNTDGLVGSATLSYVQP